MNEARFGCWSVAESPVTVEYSLVAIEEIRQAVAEGFQRLSRGGMEVGGVLYGTRDGRTVKIEAMRSIACEHARGPAFLLSDQDRSALAAQMENEPQEARLEGMICVGWFLSHTRSEIMLSDSDLEIFRDFFGAPWQVTLVIRPGRGGSMRAGFFVREPDGTVKSERSYLEFNFPDRLAGVLDRASRPDRATGDRRSGSLVTMEGGAAPMSFRREVPHGLPAAAAGPRLLPSPRPTPKWLWHLAWIVAAAAVALGGVRYFLLAPRTDPIALSIVEHEGQLQIQWNRTGRSVAAATGGTLEISDGKTLRHVPLSPQDLARGSFTYQRITGDVEVRMAVDEPKGQKIEERSQYLGSPPEKADGQALKSLQQQLEDARAEVERLRAENSSQAEQIQELERTQKILETRLGIK